MTSSVTICSNALVRLGDNPISSLQDATKAARACSNLYPAVRDAILREHPWNCARKRVILAPLVDAPAFDYPYQFQLPSDWLRTIQVGQRDGSISYTQEGRLILSYVQSLPLVYIFDNTVEQTWDSELVGVMIAAMTAVLAYPITQSAAMMTAKEQLFANVMKTAKAVNGQDNQDETLGDFPLLMSRLHGYVGVPGR